MNAAEPIADPVGGSRTAAGIPKLDRGRWGIVRGASIDEAQGTAGDVSTHAVLVKEQGRGRPRWIKRIGGLAHRPAEGITGRAAGPRAIANVVQKQTMASLVLNVCFRIAKQKRYSSSSDRCS